MASAYKKKIALVIQNFFKNNNWRYEFNKDDGTIVFNLTMKNKAEGLWNVIDLQDNGYSVYALFPLHANPDNHEQMKDISEFLNRANFGLIDGNFEFDFSSGVIRYKIHVSCQDSMPSPETVEYSLRRPQEVSHRYAPGIIAVMLNGMPAAEAVSFCEVNAEEDKDWDEKPDKELLKYLYSSLDIQTE
ncbi:hypothetical protein IJT93_08460 [bacterium]|nr:hypothetical protein [bacterium]